MASDSPIAVSVILPFADDEDTVGTSVSRLSAYLRRRELSHEIVAVSEGSGDASLFVLSHLKQDVPELVFAEVGRGGRGSGLGAGLARGRVLLFADVRRPAVGLAALGGQVERVLRDEVDVVVLPERYALCRRNRVWSWIEKVRGRGAEFERRLADKARTAGRLRVEVLDSLRPEAGPNAQEARPADGRRARLVPASP